MAKPRGFSGRPCMIAVFEKRGFRLQNDPEGSTVEVELDPA
jgi:hypothetical protein